MKAVVGLGNPGERYRGTRHNVGFDVIETLAAATGTEMEGASDGTHRAASIRLADREVLLVKPLTFMNESGRAVGPLVETRGLAVGDLLVVCDDLDLPMGRLRLRRGGSDGGHRGLRSIIAVLGSGEFPRLRLGIGRGSGLDPVEHVLTRFSEEEAGRVEELIAMARDAVSSWVAEGIEAAMNRFNKRKEPETMARASSKVREKTPQSNGASLHNYEGMFIIRNEHVAEWDKVVQHVEELLGKHGGHFLDHEKWDERRFAYEIEKQKRGGYLLAYFKLPPQNVPPLRRDLEISEIVLRNLILARTEDEIGTILVGRKAAREEKAAKQHALDEAGPDETPEGGDVARVADESGGSEAQES